MEKLRESVLLDSRSSRSGLLSVLKLNRTVEALPLRSADRLEGSKRREGYMKAEEQDKIFDEGAEDILPYLDLSKAVRPGHQAKRMNVDFPAWMVARLDHEADRVGIARQALIKVWIAERLQKVRKAKETEQE